MATFTYPSPKESRQSYPATSLNAKPEPRLSSYTSSTTSTSLSPVASPEVTSPGDSGYGYPHSPEQSPRENGLAQIRESPVHSNDDDDSDSANTASPRPMWNSPPKITDGGSRSKDKPVGNRESDRRTSRKFVQAGEEIENERSGSGDSYYSDSDFDENELSVTSSCSIGSLPSQQQVRTCV